ncbi:hypothetical protein DL96DRAFT_1605421 [Flagelloscypha sp. PMI_526]|nr:hypothetical protein DL96DRAFT_1605421 [Flagelloscypha sp. PMI_526]
MFSKAILLAAAIAYVEARFGQEQVPIQAISQVTSGGGPGVAATIAGGAISTLLAAANPCAKLQTADSIIDQLGTGADAVAAAIGLVAAEQNFNPFVTDKPTFCNDASLPKTEALRGITPLVDPAVTGADKANALSATSQKTPFDATGLSVAQVLAAQGFTNFDTKGLDGAAGPTGEELAGGAAPVNNGAADSSSAADAGATASSSAAAETTSAAAGDAAQCPTPVTVTVTGTASASASASASATATAAAGDATQNNADSGAATGDASTGGATASTIAGLDFGKCSPAIKFEGGLGGRPATEFTFQAIDPLVSKGQQEALNPAIIVNRVCDQLTNVCEANQAAKDACLAAKAKVDPAQKNAQTAVDFNTALGFADAFDPATTQAAADTAAANANPNVQKSTIAGLDFGNCVPTMKFVGGLGGRPATEFTFQAIDPLVATGQQEALNPAIIVNRICDQLSELLLCLYVASGHSRF